MYDKENIFARIIAGEIPAKKIYEDKQMLAFHDINPKAPVHALVIPKGEYKNYEEFVNMASPDEVAYFFIKITEIAEQLGLKGGYRLITNQGSESGQEVFHFHVHILGGKKLGSLAE